MNKNIENKAKNEKEYILANSYLEISFSSFGAAVRKICIKKPNGILKNIAFTLPDTEFYSANSVYAGATLAPTSGRIENGLLSINSTLFLLPKNEQGRHHIHGGRKGLSFCFWKLTDQDDHTLTFSAFLPDKVDGYPGNRSFEVTYLLKDNCLEIRQHAISDADTCFNMSNHTYFNLNAFSSSGLDQYLTIHASQVIYNNEEHIPQKTINTSDTEFDFLSCTHIGERINRCPESEQFHIAKGLNHYFRLSENTTDLPACTLLSADKKSALHITTDAPALVLYSGGFIDASCHYEEADGSFHAAYPGCAVAVEPSYAPFHTECPYAAKKFDRLIRWEFCTQDFQEENCN